MIILQAVILQGELKALAFFKRQTYNFVLVSEIAAFSEAVSERRSRERASSVEFPCGYSELVL
jgi:hypothetical protein